MGTLCYVHPCHTPFLPRLFPPVQLSLDVQRQQLQDCIDRLSMQLEEMGPAPSTSPVSLHNQRVIMDELK